MRYETYRISRSATGNEPLKGLQRTPLLSMTMTILRVQLRSITTRRASYILRGRWKKASQSRRRERRMSQLIQRLNQRKGLILTLSLTLMTI